MKQPMPVQELASYEELIARWKQDVRTAVRRTLIPMLVTTLCVAGLLDGRVTINDEILSYWTCFAIIFPFGAMLILPLAYATAGPKPTPETVAFNQALRRAFGWSDEVFGEPPAK